MRSLVLYLLRRRRRGEPAPAFASTTKFEVPRPWLALPYGVHVDALLTEAERLTPHEWAFVGVVTERPFAVACAYEALATDADGRYEAARAALRHLYITVSPPAQVTTHEVADAVVLLCAAHRIGLRGLSKASIAAAWAPLEGCAALAEVLTPAFEALGTITARGVS